MSSSPHSRARDQLYRLSEQGEFDTLINYIQQHSNESVRYGAVGVLSESTHAFVEQITQQQQQALISIVLSEPSDRIRAKILHLLLEIDESTLDNIITRLETNPKNTPTNKPYPLVLTYWVGKPQPELRLLAVVGFGHIGDQSSITKLRTLLREETNLRVINRAIKEAGDIGDESFVDPIQDYLRVDETGFQGASHEMKRDVQQTAIQALIKIGTNAAYEALVTACRTTDDELKKHAISEIGKFGARDTVDFAIDGLDGDDADMRQKAAKGVLTNFTETNFDEGDEVRQQALEKISSEINTQPHKEFRDIITESDRVVEKRNAAWLLGQLENIDNETINTLLDALHSDDEYLRKIAAASIWNSDDDMLSRKIQQFLSQTDQETAAYDIAKSIHAQLQQSADEVKKDVVNYTYISHPDEYKAQNK